MKQVIIFIALICSMFITGCSEKEDISIIEQKLAIDEDVKDSNRWTLSEAEAIALESLSAMENESRANHGVEALRVRESYVYTSNCSRSAADTVFYIVNMEPSGFAIVKADKGFDEPIFAFSFDGHIETGVNPAFEWYMNYSTEILLDEIKERNEVATTEHLSRANQPVTGIYDLYPVYYNGVYCYRKVTSSNFDRTSPLINTKWSQDTIYNKYCKSYDNPLNYSYAGCVAVALGQIFAYHRFPEQMCSHQYAWDDMLAAPIASELNANGQDCVAHLLRDIGTYVSMYYTDYGATPLIDMNSTQINQALSMMGYDSDDVQLINRSNVKKSLSNTSKKPVYVQGLEKGKNYGHAWVFDAYRTDSHAFEYIGVDDGVNYGVGSYIVNYYHFNWGWGGVNDGFYECDLSAKIAGQEYSPLRVITNMTPKVN